MPVPEVVVEGLAFGEGPRWRDGRLWFSDMHDNAVKTYTPATGAVDRIVEVDGSPSGLGWDGDGHLLIVSMDDRRLLRFDGSSLSEVADLSAYTAHPINDMVVSARGIAYIGSFGFDLHAGDTPCPAPLLRVDVESGAHGVAADEMKFPNGMVIIDDRTLVVAESFGPGLAAFTIGDGGALTDRREWAHFDDGTMPDGICLDAEGCIWVSSPGTRQFVRVREGGDIVDRVDVDDLAIACMLGDDDRKTLYLLTSKGLDPRKARELRTGRLQRVRVDVPGAGRP